MPDAVRRMAKACGIKEDQPSAKSTGSEFAQVRESATIACTWQRLESGAGAGKLPRGEGEGSGMP